MATRNLQVNGDRLWESLMEMAKIGATEKGGSRRLAASVEDKEGRDLFVRWARAAGCDVGVDAIGNIFVRRPGRDADRAPVACGSHLDTQPHGGRFDGVYGVLAGLEVLRSLDDLGIETEAPIEVVCWTNEEGARFSPSMMGSAVYAGAMTLDDAYGRKDLAGDSMGAALKDIGYVGEEAPGDRKFGAFFEVHIEQGPILEAEKKPIGVVTGVQGLRWMDVTLRGQDSHAGSTPMTRRRDALAGAAEVVLLAERLGTEPARGTVGAMRVEPNARNTIPGEVLLQVDLRNPDGAALEAMVAEFRRELDAICARRKLDVEVVDVAVSPPVAFDPDCVAAVRKAAAALELPHRDIISGAGHDACNVARRAPTSMIFIPCADGLSHNEAEDAAPEDVAAGAAVLLNVMVERAGVARS